ncbi:cystathionine beta-lyase/cystathionine gamma-synthase [Bradyrhizobium sp. USDA 3240]
MTIDLLLREHRTTSDALRAHILELEQEAEAERSSVALSSGMAGSPLHGLTRDG